jgi:hypothetical protein
MPKSKTVTLRYNVSDEFWRIQCFSICELSIRERKSFSLPSLLTFAAENSIDELSNLGTKDLIYLSDAKVICGDIPVNIGIEQWVNDRLRRVRWRLSAESGMRVTNIQLHRLIFYTIIGR